VNFIKRAIERAFGTAEPVPENAFIVEVGTKVRLAGGEKQGLYGVVTHIDDTDAGDIEITRYAADGETVADVFLLAIADKGYLQPN